MTTGPGPDEVREVLDLWDRAVQLQARRLAMLLQGGVSPSVADREPDAAFFVTALRNLYRFAVWLAGDRSPLPATLRGDAETARAALAANVPHLVIVRDAFEHFDEHLSGRTRAQREVAGRGFELPWKDHVVVRGNDQMVIYAGEWTIDSGTAAQAAERAALDLRRVVSAWEQSLGP